MKPQSHATGSENVGGRELEAKTPAADAPLKAPDVNVEAKGADKVPVADKTPVAKAEPSGEQVSAERIDPKGDAQLDGSGRVELRAGDEKVADPTKSEAADKTEPTEKGDAADKAPKADKSDKADKTDETAREPRTDRLGRWSDKLEGKTMKLGRLVAMNAHPLPAVPPGPRRGGGSGDQDVQKVDDGDAPVKPAADGGNGNDNSNTSTVPDDPDADPDQKPTTTAPTNKKNPPPTNLAGSGGGDGNLP